MYVNLYLHSLQFCSIPFNKKSVETLKISEREIIFSVPGNLAPFSHSEMMVLLL